MKYITREILNKIKDTCIIHNISKMQSDDSVMCGFYYIAFIEYMIAGKGVLDCTSLFSCSNYKKNDKITYKYFKNKYDKSKRMKQEIVF